MNAEELPAHVSYDLEWTVEEIVAEHDELVPLFRVRALEQREETSAQA